MKAWQAQLGFFGGLFWIVSFQISDWLMKNHHDELAITLYGYIFGFITVFAGHMFWGRIVQKRWGELLGKGFFDRLVSGVSLLIVFSLGLVGVYSTFNSNPMSYTAAYIVGGIVVNQGLMAIINYMDGNNQ